MSAKHDRLKVSQLLLDPNNARLPPNVRGKPEKRIIEYMLLEANLLDLMQAIAENDFFEGEQLLVVPDGQNKYRVIEGNRRLAAVKLLRDPDLATVQQSRVKRVIAEAKHKDIKELPCVIFDDEQEIHRYLGFRHITGVSALEPTAKGRVSCFTRARTVSQLAVRPARVVSLQRSLEADEITSSVSWSALGSIRRLRRVGSLA